MKTILQVEDDPNDVFFFQRAMKKGGVLNPIHVVSDGRQAINYLEGAGKFADRTQFPLPGLVLLDLKLPYVMGIEVLRWIRQQPGTPIIVVVLTASGGDEDVATAYRLGANGFLVKPSEADKLDDMVKAIRDFWLIHNALPGESYNVRLSAPAHSSRMDPGATQSRGATGLCHEAREPMMGQQKYEAGPSSGL